MRGNREEEEGGRGRKGKGERERGIGEGKRGKGGRGYKLFICLPRAATAIQLNVKGRTDISKVPTLHNCLVTINNGSHSLQTKKGLAWSNRHAGADTKQ